MKSKFLLITVLICLSLIIQAQNTIHIPGDYPTIQAGIDAAVNDDTVLVEQGTYIENINFNGKAIMVTSNYINTLDSNDIIYTIIDGSEPVNPNMASVVTFPFGSDANSVICGFTIRSGSGTLYGNRIGGGILCFDGGKIIHNRIVDNHISGVAHVFGSGIWAQGMSISNNIIIKNNIIENNQLENTNSDYMSFGAGIGTFNCNVTIENNNIQVNTSTGRPYGVGIYCSDCNGTIRDNLITDNTGYHDLANNSRGGGIYLVKPLTPFVISNNIITHNQLIHNGGSEEYGGGIAMYNTGGYENNSILLDGNIINDNIAKYGGGISVSGFYNIELSNNVIQSNESVSYGGGIYFEGGGKKGENDGLESHLVSSYMENGKEGYVPVLVNNTITGNISGINGGGVATNMISDYLLLNNIIYDNITGSIDKEMYLGYGSYAYLKNNNINTDEIVGTGSWDGNDNIDVDPQFDDSGYHLQGGSECVNAGAEFVEFNDSTYYAPDYDIDFDLRPLNDFVDIGADEAVMTDITELPKQFNNCSLINSPNPFTSVTTIEYELQQSSNVQLLIYNQFSGKVKSLMNKYQTKGKHQLKIDLSGLNPGIYFCTLKTNEGIETKKLIKVE